MSASLKAQVALAVAHRDAIVAVHEAGHAVAYEHFKRQFRGAHGMVTIEPDDTDETEGQAHHTRGYNALRNGRVLDAAQRYAECRDVIYAAGWAAVVVHYGNVAWADNGAESDFAEIPDPHVAKTAALALLRTSWARAAVSSLAAALVTNRTLSGSAVSRVLRAVQVKR